MGRLSDSAKVTRLLSARTGLVRIQVCLITSPCALATILFCVKLLRNCCFFRFLLKERTIVSWKNKNLRI